MARTLFERVVAWSQVVWVRSSAAHTRAALPLYDGNLEFLDSIRHPLQYAVLDRATDWIEIVAYRSLAGIKGNSERLQKWKGSLGKNNLR